MPRFDTRYFGTLDWPEEDLLALPQGLPGFPEERQFARFEPPRYAPLIFLQSIRTPQLCFLAAPIASIDDAYELDTASEELRIAHSPGAAADVLALLTIPAGHPPTANLLAPLVIDPLTRRGVQAIRRDQRYSCRHPLAGTLCGETLARCL